MKTPPPSPKSKTPPSPKTEAPTFTTIAETLAYAEELTKTNFFPGLKDKFPKPTIDDLKKESCLAPIQGLLLNQQLLQHPTLQFIGSSLCNL